MRFSPSTPAGARALGVLVLLVVFCAGALVATALDRVLFAEQSAAVRDEPECERRSDPLDQLDLSAEQKAEIDRILDRRREQAGAFWEEARPTLKAIMHAARAEIRDVMTPEQRDRYDELREERRAARRAAEERCKS